MAGVLILYGLGLLCIAFVAYFVIIYNGLVSLKNRIEKSWANIDVLLKQRRDEIPNILESVKGYMAHEKSVLEGVTHARAAIMGAKSPGEKAAADEYLSSSLKSLFAVAENYPDLKANQNFMYLQKRISGLENEIADRREFFNESVTNYNIRIESLPDVIVAKLLGYSPKQWFRASEEDRKNIKVKF